MFSRPSFEIEDNAGRSFGMLEEIVVVIFEDGFVGTKGCKGGIDDEGEY